MPVTKGRLITPRRAALAGMTGPALFGVGLATLTALQYDFLLGIGWQPLGDPSGAWPSGLALGPYGWVQDLDFALSGSLLAVFPVGLHRRITGGSRSGPALLFVAGVAMALLAFETDPMDRAGPRTLHGSIHDAAFVLFVLALVPALFLLWRQMREDTRWRGHARYTLATALIASACLVLPGAAYYLFLAAVLAWFEVTAVELWRTEAPSTRVRA
jgi:uncharacterized membrane protein YidH (DUF202 family)